mmetsp:Transcript_16628/g.34927  ORF Transcript_16628/g.34927 Transcript_16628/m.34927 type:complete len:81 (+) Transcript_16628:751-993(+)
MVLSYDSSRSKQNLEKRESVTCVCSNFKDPCFAAAMFAGEQTNKFMNNGAPMQEEQLWQKEETIEVKTNKKSKLIAFTYF